LPIYWLAAINLAQPFDVEAEKQWNNWPVNCSKNHSVPSKPKRTIYTISQFSPLKYDPNDRSDVGSGDK
jgi:hypothetical protein